MNLLDVTDSHCSRRLDSWALNARLVDQHSNTIWVCARRCDGLVCLILTFLKSRQAKDGEFPGADEVHDAAPSLEGMVVIGGMTHPYMSLLWE
jgi:hypothetical protein